MGAQKNTIVINGKIYDSRSGSAVGGHKHAPNKTIDGFIRRHISEPIDEAKPMAIDLTPAPKPAHVSHVSHPANKIHNRRQKSTTLMRSSVKKPKSHTPKSLSIRFGDDQPSVANASASFSSLVSKEHRAGRSKLVHKSHLISRFTLADSEPAMVMAATELPVQPHPDQIINKPVEIKIPEYAEPKSSKDIIAEALGKAASHTEPAPKKTRTHHKIGKKVGLGRKASNAATMALVTLVLGGFIAYQNMANIALHVAAAKAGVAASLPSYRPAGFGLSRNIAASPGQVVLSFHSNSDDRGFKITQTASSWNSQSLLNNFVATTDQPYQENSDSGGKTVYTYGNGNATWVSDGVWYKLEGNSSLPADQLVRIANSF